MLFLFFIAIIFSSLFVFFANNNSRTIILRLTSKGDLRPGELSYRIYFFGIIPIGKAILGAEKTEDYQGQKVYHLSASAQSLRIFSRLIKASASADSYLDMQELSPLAFKQRVNITNKPEITKEITYDQKNGIMSILDIKRQILPKTQDPLSVIFNLKHMDFDKTKDFEMNLNTNQKNYIIKGSVEQQDLEVNKKIFKIALTKAQIKRRDGNPYHQSSVSIVFLREKENIPILIKFFASGLFISAKLIDVE